MMRKIIPFLLAGLSSPALQAADIVQGKNLFETAGGYGCVVCHGPVADGAGQAGGFIRGATLEQFNASLETSDPMKPLATVLSESDRLNIAAYLGSLAQKPLLSLTYTDQGWKGSYAHWQTEIPADVVIYNETFDVINVELSEIEHPVISLNPLERKAVEAHLRESPETAFSGWDLTLEPL